VLCYEPTAPAREAPFLGSTREGTFLRHAVTFNGIPEDPQPREEAEAATEELGRRNTLSRSTQRWSSKGSPGAPAPSAPAPGTRSLPPVPLQVCPCPALHAAQGAPLAKPVFAGLASKVTAAGSAALKKASHALVKPRDEPRGEPGRGAQRDSGCARGERPCS